MRHQPSSYQTPKSPKEYPFLTGVIVALMALSLGLLILTAWSYFRNNTASSRTDSGNEKSRTILPPTGPDYRKVPASTSIDSENARPSESTHTFSRLREEVDNLLLNQRNPGDSATAALVGKLLIMSNVNRELEGENLRLREQLGKTGGVPHANEGNGLQLVKPEELPRISADEVQLTAFAGKQNVEVETGSATETEKVGGSFRLLNAGNRPSVAEIAVVVVQPDGTVMKNPGAEAGIFYTGQARRECSGKLRVTQNPGESRHINFSFTSARFSPGKYLLEIYQNGTLIGQSAKILQ